MKRLRKALRRWVIQYGRVQVHAGNYTWQVPLRDIVECGLDLDRIEERAKALNWEQWPGGPRGTDF